ncbi:MAG TPA: hypothetical protein PK777_02315 [Thermoguttaceae bacterium]|nr:hypothetical protein [Thermoguttaceae bacterium]HPP51757.1 hypothetical protein [Thermoguttaceae bacterium]
MRRTAVGLSALALLAGAAVFQWSSFTNEALAGALVRTGAVLAAVWLAYDALQRIRLLNLVGVPLLVLLVLFSRTAKWLLLIVPLVLLLALFWPRIQGKR